MNGRAAGGAGHAGHALPTGDRKALKIAGWMTGVYFFIELSIGIYTGSVAVLSDAFHTFSAVGGVLVALVASHYARRPASEYASFGLVRAEILGALVNGFFLVGMAFLVLWMGLQRLQNPMHIPTGPMLVAAAGGLITEAVSLAVLYRRQRGNLNLKGAYWHIIQTFVGSLLIIVAAFVIRFTGFYAIDPILGMAFGLVLFWASWGIIRDASRILLDAVPRDLSLQDVVDAVEALPWVKDVHHAHAWSLTAGKNVVSLHVRTPTTEDYDRHLTEVYRLLDARFGVYFATVQIETDCFEEKPVHDLAYRLEGGGAESRPH